MGIENCDCCIHPDQFENEILKIPPTIEEIKGLSEFFKVLGDPTRIKMLCAMGESELCVQNIATSLGMTKSAISHQLSGLKAIGIVKSRREGKNVFYSLDDNHVIEVLALARTHIRHKKTEE